MGLEANIATEPFNNRAHQGQSTHLFVDEVQNIRGWRDRFKSPVDSTSTKVLLTGSSALRMKHGQDSLAGRIHTGKAAALSLSEISQFRGLNCYTPFLPDNGLANLLRKEFRQYVVRHGVDNAGARDEAFTYFSERGAYPIAHNQADSDWPLLGDQLNETIIQSVLQRDITAALGADTRDAALMKRLSDPPTVTQGNRCRTNASRKKPASRRDETSAPGASRDICRLRTTPCWPD